MPRSVFGATAMSLVLAASVAAQGHQHGAQQQDTSQAAMMQMHQQMQAMHEQMMQMHGQQGGMQGMQGGMQGMQGMGQQQAMQGTCLASGSQAGLSALLLGSAADLDLTEAQRAQLQGVLDRARSEALEALTPEQRQKLEDAPAAGPMCQQTPTGADTN